MGSVLALDEALLIITGLPAGTVRHDDADIEADIDAAEGQIAEVVGPLVPTSVTGSVFSYGNGAGLPIGPYIGPITALSVNGVADVDAAGVVPDGSGFAHGLPRGLCTLTYMAGWVTLPAPVAKAVRDQFRHVWSRRRGNTRSQDAERGAAHAMPYVVSEAIEPYRWIGPKL